MGALAVLARQKGYHVTGSDHNVYPPMSTYLELQGIQIMQGYDYDITSLKLDEVIVGNTMRRGMPIVETLLNSELQYYSAPSWLYNEVLKTKKVIAVSGTHGKTTTTSLIVKLLDDADLNPGFLIGGISQDFGVSSRLTDSEIFVIEADEYDTTFFDKRSKFIHYHPDILTINNLEFDHADIFNSMDDIYRQFHYLFRMMPGKASIIYPQDDQNIAHLLTMGVWSNKLPIKNQILDIKPINADYSEFVLSDNDKCHLIKWSMLGEHNAKNALMAYTVAKCIDISFDKIQASFANFKGVKRRLECIYQDHYCAIYDDFAHHPTAVKHTLQALKAKASDAQKVVAILEARSNTMKMGAQEKDLIQALKFADEVWFYQNTNMQWQARSHQSETFLVFDQIEDIVKVFEKSYKSPLFKHFVIMSNGGFENLHQRLLQKAVVVVTHSNSF